MVFFNFSQYSKTWEIWFFVQWKTETLTHLYKYILTPPATCSQKLSVLHWIIHWYQKFTFHNVTLFKNYSLVEVVYLFIRCNKTNFFLWNTNNTDINSANQENIHTYTHFKHLRKDNIRKGGSNYDSVCLWIFVYLLKVQKKQVMTLPLFWT